MEAKSLKSGSQKKRSLSRRSSPFSRNQSGPNYRDSLPLQQSTAFGSSARYNHLNYTQTSTRANEIDYHLMSKPIIKPSQVRIP
mmetsp:Transcript_39940/g.61111  ORF Transcript_39940/g.61111 Transcript_39940/m.61111 type:complete len:84 (-) Transcript_39940:4226-4477(-)